MIKTIKIHLSEYKLIEQPNSYDYIDKLSKVNIFVGANNSGKSRFMRSILSNDLNYVPDMDLNKINDSIRKIKLKIERYFSNKNYKVDYVINGANELKEINFLNKESKISEQVQSLQNSINQGKENTNSGWMGMSLKHSDVVNEIEREIKDDLDYLIKNIPKREKYKKVYIPMLRGLRNLVHKSETPTSFESPFSDDDCYRDRTIFDYFCSEKSRNHYLENFSEEFKNEMEIFTGLKLYEDIKNMLLGDLEERDFIKKFQDFLSSRFFNNKDIALIPRVNSDVIYIKIGDENERPIFDLGDGLQTIILISFPLFKYQKDNLLLFVEEPELTLHPGMQRKILQTYCDEFPNTQIFITTHSNHLLDLTLDFEGKVSIYSFNKSNDEKFEIKNISPNKEILDLLGVRNSSVFLSNCIIWVEGISDRLYLKKYLQLYNEMIKSKKKTAYEEDKHFTILEYGGGNITHFNFDEENKNDEQISAYSISKNNLLIADKDDVEDYTTDIMEEDQKKTKRLKLFYKLLGDNFYAEHREIENTIPLKVYKKYFEELEDNAKRKWEYDSSKLDESEYNTEVETDKIGIILRKHFIKPKEDIKETSNMRFKADDINCIGNKKDIALSMIKTMDNEDLKFNELSEQTRKLVKKIYDFIETNNS